MRPWRPSPRPRKALVGLNEDLARDPLKAAGEQRALAVSLHRLTDDLATTIAGTTDEVLSNLLALADEAREKRDAATLAAEAAFGSAPIKGVGESAWRNLWEAARRYSEQVAYPERPFPLQREKHYASSVTRRCRRRPRRE